MPNKKRSNAAVFSAIAVSVLIFGFAFWLLFNRQYAIDQVSAWSYQKPAQIQAVESRLGLTGKGQFYFEASHPVIAAADQFNQDCPRQEVGSPILGCYSEGQIYIFDVTDTQLDGIEEVTAAHEMLHAAWQRMGDGERQKIGALLRTEYARLADKDLKERMDYYARTEPGEFENELHSIIATEVNGISSELESYYAHYFTDRQQVLALHQKYNSVFESLQAKSEALYNELVKRGKNLEKQSTKYNDDADALSSDIQDFNRRADNGSFASIAQFNQERASLVARSDQLEADRLAITRAIKAYKAKYDEYQKLALQIEKLNNSLDSVSNLEPAPSL